jgi:tetratricopeptide (TPR) repeat protein
MFKKSVLLVCFHFCIITTVFAQSNSEKYKEAVRLKHEMRFADAFTLFKELLKTDSTNVEYLYQTSFSYSKTGNDQTSEAVRKSYFNMGKYLAQKAIAINPNSAYAHYTYALALGRLNENASNKEKIANAKLIKGECDRSLELDPKNGSVYHILGRWHRTIAGFGALEKFAINTMYGGMPPGGSYENAIESFQKAIQLEPTIILHYYELAATYYERDKKGDNIYAKVWLEKALQLPKNDYDPDDANTRKKCEELLGKVK